MKTIERIEVIRYWLQQQLDAAFFCDLGSASSGEHLRPSARLGALCRLQALIPSRNFALGEVAEGLRVPQVAGNSIDSMWFFSAAARIFSQPLLSGVR